MASVFTPRVRVSLGHTIDVSLEVSSLPKVRKKVKYAKRTSVR
jgi:hypothetical protein